MKLFLIRTRGRQTDKHERGKHINILNLGSEFLKNSGFGLSLINEADHNQTHKKLKNHYPEL